MGGKQWEVNLLETNTNHLMVQEENKTKELKVETALITKEIVGWKNQVVVDREWDFLYWDEDWLNERVTCGGGDADEVPVAASC